MARMPHFIAIDAGGTSTRAILANETETLARASTGSIKLQRVGEPEATSRLTTLLHQLSAEADIPLTAITRTCIGLAGLTIPTVREWATRTITTHVSGQLILLGDEEIALDAAFSGSPGILLIAGTGSNCIGRALDGTLHRAGGYGHILGDAGGGYWIGLEAIRTALAALDANENANENACHSERSEESPHSARSATQSSRAPSIAVSPRWVGSTSPAQSLLTAIQNHFNLTTLPELIDLGNRRTDPTPDFASLAPVIANAATTGSPIAIEVLQRAAHHLATLITLVANKLQLPPATEIPVAFTGSILAEIPTIHAALTAYLAHSLPQARLQPHPTDPLVGALYRARHPSE
jgi:glucosamine kinase